MSEKQIPQVVEILESGCNSKEALETVALRQVRHSQIVMLGVRHTRGEREQVKDWDVRRAKTKRS